ncbi:MAG: hypothetical protein PHF98_01775 [Patescibacteria group bacterium]|nr:hypothetical protein [Patescibacteria group bacterium]
MLGGKNNKEVRLQKWLSMFRGPGAVFLFVIDSPDPFLPSSRPYKKLVRKFSEEKRPEKGPNPLKRSGRGSAATTSKFPNIFLYPGGVSFPSLFWTSRKATMLTLP